MPCCLDSANIHTDGGDGAGGSRRTRMSTFGASHKISPRATEQLVDAATRPASDNTLDLLLTNAPDLVDDLIIAQAPVKTDHLALGCRLRFPTRETLPKAARLDYMRADYDSIGYWLAVTQWPLFFADSHTVDGMYSKLVEYLCLLFEVHTPKIRPRRHRLDDLLCALRAKRQVAQPEDQASLSRKLIKISRRKRILEESKLSFKDVGGFYRYENSRLRDRPAHPSIVDGERVIDDDRLKAEHFASFFEGVYTHDDGSDLYVNPGVSAVESSSERAENKLDLSPPAVFEKLKGLKGKLSVTPNGLPPVLLKRLADVLCEPLSAIFVRAIQDGDVPQVFRTTIVTPVHKKGSKKDVQNYRPVAQSSVACLVLEKLIVDYLYVHLASRNLIDVNQHGFIKGRSTGSQLLITQHHWAIALASGKDIHCIYFDFSKAFDNVNHRLLLSKLRLAQIPSNIVDLCESWLRNRTFVCRINAETSLQRSCGSGVPQGSCLAPLLWAIYVGDIGDFMESNVRYQVYADDVKVYREISDHHDCLALQKAADQMAEWARKNFMTLSEPKCVVLKTGPHGFQYVLNGKPHMDVTAVRDLGVTVQSNLRFKNHVLEIAKKSSVLCNLILRSFITQRVDFYLKLYRAFVISKMMYCSEIWSPFLECEKRILERVQRRFIRSVARRCKIDGSEVRLQTIESLHRDIDSRVFHRLKSTDRFLELFKVSFNERRSRCVYDTHNLANSETINNIFAWRMVRMLRNTPTPLQ